MSWPGPPGPPGPEGPTFLDDLIRDIAKSGEELVPGQPLPTLRLWDKSIQSKHYIRDMTTEPQTWPRIRDLPEEERIPFSRFLVGQTIPWVEGAAREEQDAYYPWDYENWKRNPKNRFFD